MSLDILKCKKVSPSKANQTYEVSSNKSLSRIQKTGFVCVKQNRIGRNCLNDEWHKMWGEALDSPWDTPENMEASRKALDEMTIVFPNEVETKLLSYITEKEGAFFNQEELKDFDFIHIDW